MYNPTGAAAGSPGSPTKVPFIKESEYSVDRSKRLGRGGFGEVFVGSYHAQDVAVKELLLEHVSEDTKKEIEREASIMVDLRHGAIEVRPRLL